jgi:ribosomal protein S27E
MMNSKLTCRICRKPLLENTGCIASTFVTRNKREYMPVKYGDEQLLYNYLQYCPDCGTALGQYHHTNCIIEECPVCARTLNNCTCTAARFYEN